MTSHENTVETLMAPEPVTLTPEDSLAEAAARFERYSFRHLPVEQENRLVGIVSDRDLAFAIALPRGPRGPGHAPRQPRRVQEIMHADVHTILPDTSPRAALELMLARHVGALPVVTSERRLVGIVTATNFLGLFAHEHGWSPGHGPQEVLVTTRMSHPVLSTHPEEDLLEAAERLLGSHVRHLPVLEQLGQGAPIGMLSDRDVRRSLARLAREDRGREERGEPEVPRLRVGDVMSRPCMTVAADKSLRAAAHLLLECRIGALPVVAPGEGEAEGQEVVVGIVSQTDLLRHCQEWRMFAG